MLLSWRGCRPALTTAHLKVKGLTRGPGREARAACTPTKPADLWSDSREIANFGWLGRGDLGGRGRAGNLCELRGGIALLSM